MWAEAEAKALYVENVGGIETYLECFRVSLISKLMKYFQIFKTGTHHWNSE